jgi:hypothetical protein
VEVRLKLTVVYYHERQSVLIDHDNMIKPIQDALAGLIYKNDRQITDAQTRKTNIDGRFRLRHLSAVYARAFGGGREFVYIRIDEAPSHEELLWGLRGNANVGAWLASPRNEGLLRLLAAREKVELESPAPGYMTKRLYTLGLLGRDQYRILDEAVRLRNQAAHGFQVSVTQQDLARQDLARVATIARELLAELESKAA